MVRFLVSILLGAAVTFALFTFMAFLISNDQVRLDESLENIIVEVNTTPPKSAAEQRNRVPPPPPPPPKSPPKPQAPEPENNDANPGISFNLPGIDVASASTGISGPGDFGRDGDAAPIVRIDPKYPQAAAREGREGWVELSFDIDEIGGVINIKVLAQSHRVFVKNAKRALSKWKYKPKVVDGQAEVQTGLSVKLEFSIAGDQ